MNVTVIKTKIEDVKIFQPEVFNDDRGYLIESFSEKHYKDHLLNTNFVQDNESKSSYGTLRGLHFQEKPFEQAKLVRVIKGEIQDVAVDLRKESKTYKQYVSVLLNETNKKQLYVPRGFAHGFLVLSDEAIVHYKMDSLYKHEFNNGIRYDDPKINIKWKLDKSKILISEKDNKLNYL
tara:strand:+ start:204 stop:737 length:534 start_codon:yes stop_codon:yes gene_type:complete